MSETLVVYYSRKGENYMPGGIQTLAKGHTEYASEYIQKALSADLFQLETVVPYAENYRECCKQAVDELKAGARPELTNYLEDLSPYKTIFVCFPCWCGTAPMCVFTFLEHYDLRDLKIIPLCTNEGSGMANAVQDLQNVCKGAEILPGLSVLGHQVKDSEEMIVSWAKSQL